jgi:hypothetical protein
MSVIKNEVREKALKTVWSFLFDADKPQNATKMRGLASMLDCADYISKKPGYTMTYGEKEMGEKIWKEWLDRRRTFSYMRKETVKEKYVKSSVDIGQMLLKSVAISSKEIPEVMVFFESECLKYSVKASVGVAPKGRRVL